jgi:hypothetical protein
MSALAEWFNACDPTAWHSSTARSGRKVKSRKQAIAIELSKARKEAKKVPRKKAS